MTRGVGERRLLAVVLASVVLTVGGCAELEQSAAPSSDGEGTAAEPAPDPAAEHTGKSTGTSTRQRTGKAKPLRQQRQESEPSKSAPQGAPGTAAAQLATLRVSGRAPMTGYDRARFGSAWLDADRNGCDTRNDMLRRDLRPFTLQSGTRGCVVLAGVLADPYTRTRIDFVRGQSYSVDIDHVVALGNAWASGAWKLDIKSRAAFANDPLNLLAVDAGTNRSKGDANAASWLPPNKAYRCAYVARQIAVKAKYRLAVTPAEKAQMGRQLAMCPRHPATRDANRAPTRVDQNISDPGDPPRAAAAAAPGKAPRSAGGTVHYENCDAARAAGAAPVFRGDPGYGAHLDRDGDGDACE